MNASLSSARSLLVGLLVGCLLRSPPAHGAAGAAYAGLDVGDVIVATVTKVSQHAATNGDPPRVELQVHEVLRGEPDAVRRHAVWDGRPCGVDWVGEGATEAIETWKKQPVTPPLVGSKVILWGQLRRQGGAGAFHVSSSGRVPYSEAARAWAIQRIQADARRHKATAEQQAAIARLAARTQAPPRAVAAWRAQVSAADIQRHAGEADLVAVATLEGARTYRAPPVALSFRVVEVLKGQLRDVAEILTSRKRPPLAQSPYWLVVSVPRRLFELLDCRTRYVLFLSEDGLEFFSGEPVYRRIGTGDGLVVADEASLAAVREAIRGAAPEGPAKPILMLDVTGNVLFPLEGIYLDEEASEDYRRQWIAELRRAAQGRYTTFAMTGFPPGAPALTDGDRGRAIRPNGNALAMVRFERPNQPADAPAKLTWWAVRGGQGAMQIAFHDQGSVAGQEEIAALAADIVRRLALPHGRKDAAEPGG